jgi:hypothetical protein
MRQMMTNRRSLRRLIIAAALVLSFAAGVGASAAWRVHDPLLDKAVENLNGAKTLLEASEPGEITPKGVRQFNRHVSRAITACDNAISAIADAIAASDAGH